MSGRNYVLKCRKRSQVKRVCTRDQKRKKRADTYKETQDPAVTKIRIDPSSRSKLEEEHAKRIAGYRGKQSLDYYLSLFQDKTYHILHDLRIPHHRRLCFQLDTLIVSSRFILHLEIKNISGSLYFDPEFHQLIRTLDGKEEAFPDLIVQVRRQQDHLKTWLSNHKFPAIPLLSFIVISNPSTIIRSASENRSRLQI